MFTGSSVSGSIGTLPEPAAKRALWKSLYSTVIKDVQKMMIVDDTFLKAVTCLIPKVQKAYNSLQHCRVVVSEMPNVQLEEEVTTGDDWI